MTIREQISYFLHGITPDNPSESDIDELLAVFDRYSTEQVNEAIDELLERKPRTDLPIQVWVIVGDGERPYVQTSAPSPERYASLKAQGFRVYRADVCIPEKVDDGFIGPTRGEEA